MATVSLENFVLPFMKEDAEEDEDQEELDPFEQFEKMVDCVPNEAVFIGEVDSEVDNWTSWKIEDHYYVIPLADSKFQWAVFRISWDDNDGKYGWSADARASGFASATDAAKAMVKKLLKAWGIDLRKDRAHAAFLREI